jgi:hypothetical protein
MAAVNAWSARSNGPCSPGDRQTGRVRLVGTGDVDVRDPDDAARVRCEVHVVADAVHEVLDE